MVHIAIVEDNPKTRTTLQAYIERYQKESQNEFSIRVFEDGAEILKDYQPVFDVIFMDIQMKQVDGMTAAEKIREQDNTTLLVFITNMIQYAVRGYSVNATDYILKPINYFTFAEHMKRIDHILERKVKNYLVLNINSGIVKIDIMDILYVECIGHYIYIHKKDEVVSILETMKNMEQALKDNNFYRCNNGYLVNLAYVERVDKNSAFVKGEEIPISRPKKKAFMEALTDFLGVGAK